MEERDREKDRYQKWKNMIEKYLTEMLPEVDSRSQRLYEAMTYSL